MRRVPRLLVAMAAAAAITTMLASAGARADDQLGTTPGWRGPDDSGDLFNATAAFASGLQVQSFQAERHFIAQDSNRFAGAYFTHYEEDVARPPAKMPLAWILGFSDARITLPPASNGTLTDETVAFKIGIDWRLMEQASIGATFSLQNTPEENFNVGIFHLWLDYLFPLKRRSASVGGDDEDAATYFARVNEAKAAASVPAASVFPQVHLALDIGFFYFDQGAENPNRFPGSNLATDFTNDQSAATGRLTLDFSPGFAIWGSYTSSAYRADPGTYISRIQLGSRIPTDQALAQLGGFPELLTQLPSEAFQGGLHLGMESGFGLDAMICYNTYSYTLASTFCFGAMAHIRLGQSWRIGAGADITSATLNNSAASGPAIATPQTQTTGAVSLGYFL